MCWRWYDEQCICSIMTVWLLAPGGGMRYLLSVVQVLHGQPRVALPQTLPGKAAVGQGELQAGGRQKWWWGGVVWQNTILGRDDRDANRISHKMITISAILPVGEAQRAAQFSHLVEKRRAVRGVFGERRGSTHHGFVHAVAVIGHTHAPLVQVRLLLQQGAWRQETEDKDHLQRSTCLKDF